MVNNFRFLILPWVRVENLGSRILSEAQRVVLFDWERLYGFRSLYFETFVDGERFRRTVYRAANWLLLGMTEGKGRKGLNYFFHGRPPQYYLLPLKNC